VCSKSVSTQEKSQFALSSSLFECGPSGFAIGAEIRAAVSVVAVRPGSSTEAIKFALRCCAPHGPQEPTLDG
jgi:hypothetical protein